MKRILAMMLAAAFGLPAFADDPPKKTVPEKPPETKKDDEKKPETREEKFAAINKDMAAERTQLLKDYRAEEDKDAKAKLANQINTLPAKYVEKALALAEENPKDDVGLQSILFVISSSRTPATTKKATTLLTTYHVENPKIADRVLALGRGSSTETVSFLKAVLARNPDQAAKGRAAYALVQGIADKIEAAKTDDAATSLEAEAKTLLKRMETEFADVPLMPVPPNSKVKPRLLGKLAVSEAKGIANLKNLKVGKPIPEIEGPDMDGKTFKISDYKGKVVLLDFWGHW